MVTSLSAFVFQENWEKKIRLITGFYLHVFHTKAKCWYTFTTTNNTLFDKLICYVYLGLAFSFWELVIPNQ